MVKIDALQNDIVPKPIKKFLKDYQTPSFWVDHIDLDFLLEAHKTRVTSQLKLRRNHEGPLELDGEDLKLMSVKCDGKPLSQEDYTLSKTSLTLHSLPDRCQIETVVEIEPITNTKLLGLYVTKGGMCTQCEAEGFRRITFFPDRPDVMSKYRVKLTADKTRYPVLLANGNCLETGDLEGGKHFAVWEDPFAKPCYLFALVAGDFGHISDTFTTRSGRVVDLKIYVEHGKEQRSLYAMDSLKRSMKWDEDRFGLEYDLDIFNIVAVSDFNFGAMENKSLNIFNDAFIIADEKTATDANFINVERVVGHEYFHNWTGDRVTCRDWFQLSLKEGLTVFREQEFAGAMRSRSVVRIQDVSRLRSSQFPEDSSPLAHPVRPQSYIEIDNFYTATIYEKGAEIIHMMHRLIGEENFQKGMKLYFKRHDGQAVTCDDFVAAMQDASGYDMTHFKLWYAQAGTPRVKVGESYDAQAKTYTLSLEQNTPDTLGQTDKKAVVIPLKTGLLDDKGEDMQVSLNEKLGTNHLLVMTQGQQNFTFEKVLQKPTLSINREFSAPVIIRKHRSGAERAFLMGHDGDSFNRWDAGQEFAVDVMQELSDNQTHHKDLFIEAFGKTLKDVSLDTGFKGLSLTLPSLSTLIERTKLADVQKLHEGRQALIQGLYEAYRGDFVSAYESLTDTGPFKPDALGEAKRSLRNRMLSFIAHGQKTEDINFVYQQFETAGNMTDKLVALNLLCQLDTPYRVQALDAFYTQWKEDKLVLNKWLSAQASASWKGVFEDLERLMSIPEFEMTNPNQVRSVVGGFSGGNPLYFHSKDYRGYQFLAQKIMVIDGINPMVAARLSEGLSRFKSLAPVHQQGMKQALELIMTQPNLSRGVYENVTRGLQGS